MKWNHKRLNDHMIEHFNDVNNVTIIRNDEDWQMGRPRYVVVIAGVYIRGCEVLEPLTDYVSEAFPDFGFYSFFNNSICISRPEIA